MPLFGYEVPVLADEDVDPEYGTGLMMVCTFGDSEDVLRWRRDHLDLRLVVQPDGRLGELAGPFAGLPVTQARAAIVKALDEAGLLVSSVPVRQVVGVHERCQTPVEFQIRPQWFIAVRENADRFRARAAELEWIPPFMRRGSRTGSTGSSGTGTSPGSGGTGCRSRSGSAPRATRRSWPGSRTCRWTR